MRALAAASLRIARALQSSESPSERGGLAGAVVGWEREVSYVGLEATPAKIAADVSDAPRDAAGTENRKRSRGGHPKIHFSL